MACRRRPSTTQQTAMFWLWAVSCAAWGITVAVAYTVRSRAYALFRGVHLGLHTSIALAVAPSDGWLLSAFVVLHALVYVQALVLAWPRPRPLWYRALVS